MYPTFCLQHVLLQFRFNISNTVTVGWMELLGDWIRNKNKKKIEKGKRTPDSVGPSFVIKFTPF